MEFGRSPAPIQEGRTIRGLLPQLVTYSAVGLIGTAGHYLTLICTVRFAGLHPVPASALGFGVGAVLNYFANYYITFRSTRRHLPTLVLFLSVAVLGLAVNTAVMTLFTVWLRVFYLASQVVASGVVVLVTYVVNRVWTFRGA